MRCKCCNSKLKDFEIQVNEDTGELEELCTKCLSLVQLDLDDASEEEMLDALSVVCSDE